VDHYFLEVAYAVFDATIPTLDEVIGRIYNSWLATSDYQPATGFNFERYGETFDPHDPNSTVNIYIPAEKKAERRDRAVLLSYRHNQENPDGRDQRLSQL
jgi:hypothetical protein